MGEEVKSSSQSRIPQAQFVENMDSFMAQSENASNREKVLSRLEEQLYKYKYLETNLIEKRERLRDQVSDLERSLDMIHLLKKHRTESADETIDTEFLLSEQLYSKATIKASNTVYLWLGANVMLEYGLDDAAELLSSNINVAKKSEKSVEEDLEFLRDQITTTEVNMARVFNWIVKKHQAENASSS